MKLQNLDTAISDNNWVYSTPPSSPRASVRHIPQEDNNTDTEEMLLVGTSLFTGEERVYFVEVAKANLGFVDVFMAIYNSDMPHFYSYLGGDNHFDHDPDAAMIMV